jgi:hypothetical protein
MENKKDHFSNHCPRRNRGSTSQNKKDGHSYNPLAKEALGKYVDKSPKSFKATLLIHKITSKGSTAKCKKNPPTPKNS